MSDNDKLERIRKIAEERAKERDKAYQKEIEKYEKKHKKFKLSLKKDSKIDSEIFSENITEIETNISDNFEANDETQHLEANKNDLVTNGNVLLEIYPNDVISNSTEGTAELNNKEDNSLINKNLVSELKEVNVPSSEYEIATRYSTDNDVDEISLLGADKNISDETPRYEFDGINESLLENNTGDDTSAFKDFNEIDEYVIKDTSRDTEEENSTIDNNSGEEVKVNEYSAEHLLAPESQIVNEEAIEITNFYPQKDNGVSESDEVSEIDIVEMRKTVVNLGEVESDKLINNSNLLSDFDEDSDKGIESAVYENTVIYEETAESKDVFESEEVIPLKDQSLDSGGDKPGEESHDIIITTWNSAENADDNKVDLEGDLQNYKSIDDNKNLEFSIESIKEENIGEESQEEKLKRAEEWLAKRNKSNSKSLNTEKGKLKATKKKDKKSFILWRKKKNKEEGRRTLSLLPFFSRKNKNQISESSVLVSESSVLEKNLIDTNISPELENISFESRALTEDELYSAPEVFVNDLEGKDESELKEEIKFARIRARLAERDLEIARKKEEKSRKLAAELVENQKNIIDLGSTEETGSEEIEMYSSNNDKLQRAAKIAAEKKISADRSGNNRGGRIASFFKRKDQGKELDIETKNKLATNGIEITTGEIDDETHVVVSKDILERAQVINSDEIVLKREDLERLKEEFSKKDALIQDLQESDKFGVVSESDEENKESDNTGTDFFSSLEEKKKDMNLIDESKLNELLSGLSSEISEDESSDDNIIKPITNPIVTYAEDTVKITDISISEEMGDLSSPMQEKDSIDENKLKKIRDKEAKRKTKEEVKLAKIAAKNQKKADKRRILAEKKALKLKKKEEKSNKKLEQITENEKLSKEEISARKKAEKIEKASLKKQLLEDKKLSKLTEKRLKEEDRARKRELRVEEKKNKDTEKKANANIKREERDKLKAAKELEKEEKRETKNLIKAEKKQRKLEKISERESKRLEKKLMKQDEKKSKDYEKGKVKNAQRLLSNESQSVRIQRRDIRRNEKREEKLAKKQARDLDRQLKAELKSAMRAEKIRRKGKEASILADILTENKIADKELEKIKKKSEGMYVPVFDMAPVSFNPTAPASYSWEIEGGLGNTSEINHLDYNLPEPLPRR